MKKIKLIHLITSLNFGGAEIMLLNLVRFLDKEKFEIKIGSLIEDGPLKKKFENLKIEVKVFKKKSKLGLELIPQLKKYFLKERPQIVHTHLFASDFWGKIAAWQAKVPFIVTTEHNLNFNEGKIKHLLKRITYRFTSKVIAVSQTVADYLKEKYRVSPQKIKVIYNGIDLAFWQREKKKLKREEIIIGNVGRLEKQKGQRYLLLAFKEVLQEFPKARLQIIGQGREKENLFNLAQDLEIKERVEFISPSLKIKEIMEGFDLFVLSSLWEGFGLSLLEAQALGIPVITSDIGGCNEFIYHRVNGLLFPKANPLALASEIIWLLKHPQEGEKIVREGLERIKKFDIKKIVKEYEELYEDIVS